MILKDENADRAFKSRFAACVTHDELRIAELLTLLKAQKDFTDLGEAFRFLAAGETEKAELEARRGYQAAVDSDEAALFALSDILRLLPSTEKDVLIFADLPTERLHSRASLFDHLNRLMPGKFSLRELAALEVQANCRVKMQWLRIGQHGPNRISDLLHGSESDQEFALDLLDQAHGANMSAYDECYTDLILAKTRCTNKTLRERLATQIAQIEQQNPTQVLPNALATVVARIRAGESPSEVFCSQESALQLSSKDMGQLALATADLLCESGDEESAAHLLSAAAKYIGSDVKSTAWAALLLGDRVHAARAMFSYGLQRDDHPFFARIERFHSVELACRLMYEMHTAATRQELKDQSGAYERAGFGAEASRIREWVAAFDGFLSYVKTRLERCGEPVEDPDELRISQRQIAELHYLRAIVLDDPDEIAIGVDWFEKSAIGNDAQWIEGERMLLNIATSATDTFRKARSDIDVRIRELEGRLLRAAELIRSDYPIAISLALRGSL